MNLGRNALRAAAAIGVAGALTAGLVGAVGTASAAPANPAKPATNCTWQGRGDGSTWQSSFAGDGINIHSGDGAGCTVVGAGYSNQTVTIYCDDGTDNDGGWFYLRDNATGVTGWVAGEWLNFDPEDAPPICG